MGVERAVTRWYIQRQNILNELTALEARIAQLTLLSEAEDASESRQLGELQQAQEKVRLRLHKLGPSPAPKMG